MLSRLARLPAPPALVGALLVLATTLGHLAADKQIAGRAGYNVVDEGSAKAAFPSFETFDGWRGREDRILLRNAFADCGISTYCGLAAIWLIERDDACFWEADFSHPRAACARHWIAQVAPRFEQMFGELKMVGRFWNGEAIFERYKSCN